MPNENLKTTSNPNPDSASSLNNRDALYSLFGLKNNYPFSNPKNGNGQKPGDLITRSPTPPETICEAAEQADQDANIACEAAKVANELRDVAKNARTDIQQIIESIKKQATAIETIMKNAEDHAKKAEQYGNDIKWKKRLPPPTPYNSINDLMNFLKKYKFLLLFGAVALIPLLLWLSGVLLPKPSIQAYVNPITGDDANDGTAATPFRTLSRALQQAGAGSEIYLAKGDYSTDRSLTIPDNTTLMIQPFSDINGHWAAPFIRAMATQGLIAGYPDGNFRPDANLTRAEYATLLTKVFDLPEARAVKNFSDVGVNFWAYSPIQSTYSKNFLKGFPEGYFLPDAPVQRVQVIAALVSGLGLSPRSTEPLNRYQDRAIVPDWARQQVAAATTAQLVANHPNLQRLNPIQSATRAETVVMMYQALVNQGKMPAIKSPYLVKQ